MWSGKKFSALLLSASLCISCGSLRLSSRQETQLDVLAQHRKGLAESFTQQLSRDSLLEEWEIVLLDTVIPQIDDADRAIGDTLTTLSRYKRSPWAKVRYLHARHTTMARGDSVSLTTRQEEQVTQQRVHKNLLSRSEYKAFYPLPYLLLSTLLVVLVSFAIWSIYHRMRVG